MEAAEVAPRRPDGILACRSEPIFARVEEVSMPIQLDLAPRRSQGMLSKLEGKSDALEVALPPQNPRPRIESRLLKVEKKSVSPRAEMRERIKNTLEEYPGIKNGAEQIRRKAEEGRQKLAARESEYWAWQQEMKAKAQPRWKMPQDSLAGNVGRERAEEEILEKVEKAQKSMAETTHQYKAWVKDMEKKRQEELQQKLQERQQMLKNFEVQKKEAKLERAAGMREDQDRRAQQAGRYWTWLSDTKNTIAKREVAIAPLTRVSGVKSVEELTQIKRAELAEEIEQREREYKEWLASISKSKFTVPTIKCNSVQERDALINEKAKKSIQKLNQTTAEYTKWVKDVEQQHHDKAMARVREKLLADKAFNLDKESAQLALRRKQFDAKRNQQHVADENRKAVKEMLDRVQAKPLNIEQAYHFGRHVNV